jgi:hypothetical protein
MADPFYNRTIRKLVVGFGNLFNNITLVRYNPNQTEQERFVIPIAYATKELYVKRLQEDPDLDKKIAMSLPRLSFEMTGFSYDASRKQNTNIKNFAAKNNNAISQYNPVPYNFDFSLYLYVRNIEDATQVLEHILSYFTPDYTIKLNLIPEMGIVKEIPIILNNTSQEIEYEGNADSPTRMIIWTLNFTVKGFIYGAVSPAGGIIRSTVTNIIDTSGQINGVNFYMIPNSGIGDYKVGELIYQGYSPTVSLATGRVKSWANNVLTLIDYNGNFTSEFPLIGIDSNANYNYINYDTKTYVISQISLDLNPLTANVGEDYLITQRILEQE